MKNKLILSILVFLSVSFQLSSLIDIPESVSTVLYMDIGGFLPLQIKKTSKTISMKSDANSLWFNRTFGKFDCSKSDITIVKTFYGKTPFSWWIEEPEVDLENLLKSNGFIFTEYSTSMACSIDNVNCETINDEVEVIKLDMDKDSDLDLWIKTSAQGFGMQESDIRDFVVYLCRSRSSNEDICFYIGYIPDENGDLVAAASSFLIKHANFVVSLHLVSTIKEYRKKGLGYAVSLRPLVDAKKLGFKTAFLTASKMSQNIYSKIGFKPRAKFKVFSLKDEATLKIKNSDKCVLE